MGRGRVEAFLEGAGALAKGFSVTARHLFRRPVTEEYPEYKRPLPARSRARLVLTRDPDGGERCVACSLCAAACPVGCISMQAAEGPGGRRYARWFRVHFGRCIYCGFCEEACPTLALQLTPHFENGQRDLLSLVAEKEDLLVDHGGKNRDYSFFRHAGVAVDGPKGSHENEEPPVDPRSLLP